MSSDKIEVLGEPGFIASQASMASATSTPSLKRRMACWIYEGMLMFGVAFLAAYLFGTMSQQRHALSHRLGLMAFLYLIFGIYFVWFWAKGQTLAMKTWNIRVVSTSGQPITQLRALARYVLSWLWLLPPLALISPMSLKSAATALLVIAWILVYALLSRLNPQKQFWHDVWAGTRLVDSKPLSR
jgi:uncharacterized RDD family membrane protein YckC